jgi:sialidase-1
VHLSRADPGGAGVAHGSHEMLDLPAQQQRRVLQSTLRGLAHQPQPAAATDGPTAPLVVEQLDVFTSGAYGGTDDYHTFRIPSLVVSPRGTLLTIVEGRKDSRGDLSNVHLVCKRSDDGGRCVGLTPGGPT